MIMKALQDKVQRSASGKSPESTAWFRLKKYCEDKDDYNQARTLKATLRRKGYYISHT